MLTSTSPTWPAARRRLGCSSDHHIGPVPNENKIKDSRRRPVSRSSWRLFLQWKSDRPWPPCRLPHRQYAVEFPRGLICWLTPEPCSPLPGTSRLLAHLSTDPADTDHTPHMLASTSNYTQKYWLFPPTNKKLIRRWDSERGLFYDDILHTHTHTSGRPPHQLGGMGESCHYPPRLPPKKSYWICTNHWSIKVQ